MCMEIYTLEELYTSRDTFVTDILDAVSTYYGSTFQVDTSILSYELRVIYEWYRTNYTSYGGEMQDVLAKFKRRLVQDICDVYLYVERKIKHFISVNQDTLFTKGGMTSDTLITPDLQNEMFTKQANTPSVVEQASDFVDSYTDYQSKTTSSHTGTDTHHTDIVRTGSQEDVLKVLALLPKSLSEDLIDGVKWDFLIMGDALC